MGITSHPHVDDFKGSPANTSVKASSMLAVTQPCGTLCVPPLTPIHPWLGKWSAQPLIPNLNSRTPLLEKSLLVLGAKLTLKPKWMLVFSKTAPSQHFLSLTCSIYSQFVPSWQGTGCVESGGWQSVYAVRWGQVPAPRPGWDQDSKTVWPGPSVLQRVHKTLEFVLLEQYI